MKGSRLAMFQQLVNVILCLVEASIQSNPIGVIILSMLILSKLTQIILSLGQFKHSRLCKLWINFFSLLGITYVITYLESHLSPQTLFIQGVFLSIQLQDIMKYYATNSLLIHIIFACKISTFIIFYIISMKGVTVMELLQNVTCFAFLMSYMCLLIYGEKSKIQKVRLNHEQIQSNMHSGRALNGEDLFIGEKSPDRKQIEVVVESLVDVVQEPLARSQYMRKPTNTMNFCIGESSKNLFNLIPMSFLVINKEQQIVYFNRKSEKLFRTSNPDHIYKELQQIFDQPNMLNPQQTQANATVLSISQQMNFANFVPNTVNQQQFDNLLKLKRMNKQASNLDVLEILLNPHRADLAGVLNSVSQMPLQMSLLPSQQSSQLDGFSHTLHYEQEYLQNSTQKKLTLSIQVIQGEFGVDEQVELHDSRKDNNQSRFNLVILIDDVTKKRNYVEVQRRLKFQHELLLSFSHELRTPLNCSVQLLSVAQEIAPKQISDSLIKPALNSNLLLLYQINDCLDYAALQTKSFVYRFSSFTFNEIITDLNEIFEFAIQYKKIQFRQSITQQLLDTTIYSDKQRLLQVIRTLILNSMKFTQVGGTIELFVRSFSQQNIYDECYKIGVRDTGIGLRSFTLDQIQEHLKNQSTNKYKDFESESKVIGLGFKVSNKLISGLYVEDRPNFLKLKSQNPGLQVSFYISNKTLSTVRHLAESTNNQPILPSLSFVRSQHSIPGNQREEHHAQTIRTNKPPFMSRGKHTCKCRPILIVDDEPFNVMALQQLLMRFQLRAEEAYDGQQAINMVKMRLNRKCCDPTYRLIIMDIQMPSKNGLQASQEIFDIFNLNQKLHAPVIVICSAFDTSSNMSEALKIGIFEFLNKPVRKNTLQQVLQKYELL